MSYPRSPKETLGGYLHLPRFIDKARLFLGGNLPKDYQKNFGGGYDGMFLKTAKISKNAFLNAVKTLPDDASIQKWVKKNSKAKAADIKAFNAAVLAYPGSVKGNKKIKRMVDVIDFEESRFLPTRIAFVGVGRMGANMARRLHDLGFHITAVYDVYRASAEALAKEIGTKAPLKLSEVTASADIIITVVTNDQAMKDIFFKGGDNLLKGAKGRIFINCATLSPAIHLQVEKAAAKAGAKTLEACMASSITQARNGTLYLMCGGDKKVFEKVAPVLNAMSLICRFVGKAGDAAKVKALVNMVMNINTAGLAEGLGLADAMKLDLTLVREVFSQTGANSRVLVTDGEDMQNRDHSCFFSGEHAAKDSGIALTLAKEQKLSLPLAAASKAQFDKMVTLGIGDLDKSGVAELTFKGRKLHKK